MRKEKRSSPYQAEVSTSYPIEKLTIYSHNHTLVINFHKLRLRDTHTSLWTLYECSWDLPLFKIVFQSHFRRRVHWVRPKHPSYYLGRNLVFTLDPPWAWKPRPTLWIHWGLWLRCVHPFGIKWSPPVTRHPMLHTLVKHVFRIVLETSRTRVQLLQCPHFHTCLYLDLKVQVASVRVWKYTRKVVWEVSTSSMG